VAVLVALKSEAVGVTPSATIAYTKFVSPPLAVKVASVVVPQVGILFAEAVIVSSGSMLIFC